MATLKSATRAAEVAIGAHEAVERERTKLDAELSAAQATLPAKRDALARSELAHRLGEPNGNVTDPEALRREVRATSEAIDELGRVRDVLAERSSATPLAGPDEAMMHAARAMESDGRAQLRKTAASARDLLGPILRRVRVLSGIARSGEVPELGAITNAYLLLGGDPAQLEAGAVADDLGEAHAIAERLAAAQRAAEDRDRQQRAEIAARRRDAEPARYMVRGSAS